MFPKSLLLTSARLRLRFPSLDDIPHIFSATRYPGFNDGMLWEPPASEAELIEAYQSSVRAWEKGSGYPFAIDRLEDGRFVGRISIRKTGEADRWNVGFWTHPALQGNGYMTEALKVVLQFGFEELDAKVIEAAYALWNKASEKVLMNNEMQFVRRIEKGFQKRGEWVAENLMEVYRK